MYLGKKTILYVLAKVLKVKFDLSQDVLQTLPGSMKDETLLESSINL